MIMRLKEVFGRSKHFGECSLYGARIIDPAGGVEWSAPDRTDQTDQQYGDGPSV
jgi:hypothetical protein